MGTSPAHAAAALAVSVSEIEDVFDLVDLPLVNIGGSTFVVIWAGPVEKVEENLPGLVDRN
jgi:hypothetical protein